MKANSAMLLRIAFVGVAALVCSGAIETAGLAAEPVVASSLGGDPFAPGNVNDNVQWAITFRRDHGFDARPDAVAAYQADPSLSHAYGIGLTDAEEYELRRRDAITSHLEPLNDALTADADFGGLYFDQASGGVVDIATIGDPITVGNSVAKWIPSGAAYRVRHVEHSLNELDLLQARITEERGDWATVGLVLFTVGVDVLDNQVAITATFTPSQEAAFVARYGSAASLRIGPRPEPAACVDRHNCRNPMKGGLAIASSNGIACTSGYLGRNVSGLTNLYLLTAGHCIDPTHGSGLAATWYHPAGTAIGTGAFEYWFTDTYADVGGIHATEGGSKNQIFASGPTDILAIGSSRSNANQAVGADVCLSGLNSHWVCGTVVQTNTGVQSAETYLLHQWDASFGGLAGDSGGPMVSRAGVAMGIFSTLGGWYSTIDYISSQASVRPCYTAACG